MASPKTEMVYRLLNIREQGRGEPKGSPMIPRFSSFLFSGLTLIFVLSSCASDDGFQVFKQQSQEDLVEVVEQINPGPGSPGENPGDPITPPPASAKLGDDCLDRQTCQST